jgi:hypothetical protein
MPNKKKSLKKPETLITPPPKVVNKPIIVFFKFLNQ